MVPLFLLSVVAGACGSAAERAPGSPSVDATIEPSTEASHAPREEIFLATIPISEPPRGMVFDAEDLGDAATNHLLDLSPSDVAEAVRVGWVDAVLRQYWSPEFMNDVFSGASIPQNRFERPDYWTVLSGAALYEDAGSAEAALDVYIEDYPASWGLRESGGAELGDGGAIFEGSNPVGGAPQIVIVWRSGRYLLHVVATGSVEAAAREIRQIAKGMQSRAEAASAEPQ